MAREAAAIWSHESRAAVACRGRFRVALCGGRTPAPLFRLLAREDFRPVDQPALPWDRTDVFWADERYVPHSHAESNFRLAKETLLDHVPVPPENVFPMPTASGDPARDAADYGKTLRRAFPGQAWPRFDLVLLGLGEDGHTASLFPGDAALSERTGWVARARAPKGVRDRLTLTVPALNAARLKLLLACGEAKSAVLRRLVWEPDPQPSLPVGLVEDLLVLTDRAAAADLSPGSGI
ncbi:MAG: 6-phosphogluconolactonase [Elusimicrobia bacterium]|nr:6-phosphogluconolactonase [Elusimicrobiota bacterium]